MKTDAFAKYNVQYNCVKQSHSRDVVILKYTYYVPSTDDPVFWVVALKRAIYLVINLVASSEYFDPFARPSSFSMKDVGRVAMRIS